MTQDLTSAGAPARNHGLDTLRTIAILLVLMYHYMVVVTGKNTFGFMTEIGWTGVDLFFVLSGYLIGDQILSHFARRQPFEIGTFFIRRALRTLPNYFVVLALYLLLPQLLAGKETASLWRFLTFTQNLGMHPGETFTHSWSLCIEEQFYLILPLAAVLIARVKGAVCIGWVVLCGAIVAGVIVRSAAWSAHGQAAITSRDYYEFVYYSSFARFDELLPGVAIAMLKNFSPEVFARITRRGNVLLVAGLLAVAAMFWALLNFLELPGGGYGYAMTAYGYPLLAISFGLLTLAALSQGSLFNRVRVPGAEQIALGSYAIYLVHKPVFKLMVEPLAALHIDNGSAFGIAIMFAVSAFAGWLLYWLVETPFMKLRSRYFQPKGKPAPARGALQPRQA